VPRRFARQASLLCHPVRAASCAAVAALGLAISSGSLQTAIANGDTRSLTFQHTHRDDGLTVTFKRDGRYDQDGLAKLNYFLRDWRTDDVTQMDPRLFDVLWEVTREVDTKNPIRIVSSYRSPKTNAMLRRRSHAVAQFSQHMLGKAIDFNIEGVSLDDLRAAGMRLQRGGVGFYPGAFVHVDVGSVRHWPRMTHDQLARVFPNGRTVHVPSDGQPLAGYALALADIEKRGSSPNGTSLAAARNAGAISDADERVAMAGKPKKGFFSKLFGFSADGEEDEDLAPARTTKVAAAESRPETKTESKTDAKDARVPTPQARPMVNPKPAAGSFALASASSTPVTLPSRTVPRPPAEITEPTDTSAARETTSSITAWLNDAEFGRPDRVPPNMALAYAAQAAPDAQRPAAVTPPAGAARSVPAATAEAARIPPKAGQRYNDPWLRSITLATSVHTEMNVTVYGKLDVRHVRMMMIKPVTSVPMAFGGDPYEGMQTTRFAGAAVTFLPTVSYAFQPQRQASLQ
jgi:uncharacterized protein YcbK (DUF882 family)